MGKPLDFGKLWRLAVKKSRASRQLIVYKFATINRTATLHGCYGGQDDHALSAFCPAR